MNKRKLISRIVVLCMAVSAAGLFGCDEEKDDNKLIQALLLTPEWKVATPKEGATNVSVKPTLVLEHNGNLEESISKRMEITLNYDDTYISIYPIYDFTIVGDTVTISGFDLNAATTYSSMYITGFSDAEGKVIPEYTISNYNFTTEPAPK